MNQIGKENRAQKMQTYGAMVVREGRNEGGDQKQGPQFPREGYQGGVFCKELELSSNLELPSFSVSWVSGNSIFDC